MENLRIENAQNIVDAAMLAIDHFGGGLPWWRGQSLSPWQLRPSVFRVADGGYRYEQNIASKFIQRARTRYPDCPVDTDLPGWFLLMQHYGLPTRILDWSESILVATYFAVCDAKHRNEDGAIWALAGALLNEEQFDQRVLVAVGNRPVSTLFDQAATITAAEPCAFTAAISSHHTDTRMMSQLSEFTIHGTDEALENLPNNEKFVMKFIVPKTAKASLRDALKLFGISEAALFPDLGHLASEIRASRFQK